MKKFLSILLSLVSIICISFAFVGCGEDETETGTFYTVTEAYESGYLTREQVMSIAYYHNDGRGLNEGIMDENYTPLPKSPENLSTETDKAIKDSFYNSDKWEEFKDYYAYEDIGYGYYGTYGNAVAVKIAVSGQPAGTIVWKEEIDGIKIDYRNTLRILVWLNND